MACLLVWWFFMYKLRSCTNDKFKNIISSYITLWKCRKTLHEIALFLSTLLQNVAYMTGFEQLGKKQLPNSTLHTSRLHQSLTILLCWQTTLNLHAFSSSHLLKCGSSVGPFLYWRIECLYYPLFLVAEKFRQFGLVLENKIIMEVQNLERSSDITQVQLC